MDFILSGGEFPIADLTCGYRSLGEYCQAQLSKHADQVLLLDDTTKEEVTGTQLLRRCNKLARSLFAAGIRPGDAVAICCDSELDLCYVMIACFLLGAAFVPLAVTYADHELIHLLSLARPSIVFATKHESDQQLNRVAIKCDFIRSIFMYGRDFGEMSVGFTNDPDDVEMFGCQPEDCRTRTAVILSSSGTTGLPKGVELSQMNIFASFHMAYLDDSEVYLAVTSLIHISGCIQTIKWLMAGKKSILMSRYNPVQFLEIMQNHKIAAIFLAQPQMHLLAYHPIVDNYDLSALKFIAYGNSPISESIVRQIRLRLTVPYIVQVYGLTEATGLLAQSKSGHVTSNSLGKLRPGAIGKVVDPDSGRTLPPNKHGEMMFKSCHNLKGYVNNTAATEAIYDADGFIHTGDIGYYNESKEWFFVERMKELIKYNTICISPTQMEMIIAMHPAVEEVCVVGKPDRDTGEVPMAFIVKNVNDISLEEIGVHLAKYLAPPRCLYGGIRFVDSLPKNYLGKFLRKDLRKMLSEET